MHSYYKEKNKIFLNYRVNRYQSIQLQHQNFFSLQNSERRFQTGNCCSGLNGNLFFVSLWSGNLQMSIWFLLCFRTLWLKVVGKFTHHTHFPKDPNENNKGFLQKTCWYSRAKGGTFW